LGIAAMVLVSFHKQFVFTKTNKTAGTSVEVFFEPYCLPPDGYVPMHWRDDGVVGYRGGNRPADTQWYNHMPAERIREYLGADIWNEFFKFCVVRNPYDKLTSMYFFNMDQAKKDYLKEQDFSVLRSDYLAWLRRRRFTGDRDKYLIDGSVCVDYFIRHESLLDDLKEVCRRLGIDRDVAELEKFKSQSRPTDRHFSEFYDDEGAGIVAEAYAFKMGHFGYRLRE
jgi:hypothetical protein